MCEKNRREGENMGGKEVREGLLVVINSIFFNIF